MTEQRQMGRGIYIRREKPEQTTTQTGSRKYEGDVATGYDAKREKSEKWQEEDRIVKEYLEDCSPGDWILDCPVGTGRFIPFYEEKGLLIRAIDISADMIAEATKKVKEKTKFYPAIGDVRGLGLNDDSVNVSVMVRLTRWLKEEGDNEVIRALKELQRVTRHKIILTARVRNHKFAVPYGLIVNALDGWEITGDEGIKNDRDYRVIMLEPKDR